MSYPVPPVHAQENITSEECSYVWLEWFRQLRDRVLATTSDYESTSIPTTGNYKTLDFVRNSAPTELGVAGSKYFIFGWYCLAGGSPGTWVPMKILTGN